ncbi:cation-translocating P-type ATPase [Sulfurisoma sediminicola]|uniref:Sodium/potassium-transporting ATPase subunit alpha n=1 Tax=Sulfurisoma sediminicola TaxID=1381557 RepID=A0A497XH49_9PROT|nr:cation-transporting P-type ATPase [Sulfurisoma sediminicola]RLJ65317.1 sodium/potassium-transporting ATPase subunit alpha [Sulfurisoma sediminicola]
MNPPVPHIAEQSPDAALAALGSGPQGLSAAEARRRLAEFGPNRVEPAARDPVWLTLAREFTHFFALILWLAAALALVAEHFGPGQGMAELGLAIVGVIVVNGCFSFWQAWRAEAALAALSQLLPQQVQVRRDGLTLEVPAAELVPGDIVLLAEGAKVPADCRLIESWGLRVNLATLTGESRPKARSADAISDAIPDPLAARALVLAGTLIVSGECSAVVFATGMRTEFGRIAHLTQTAGEVESPLQKEIRRVSRLVALLALTLGLVFFAIGQAIGLPFWANFMFAIGIIVANVPEGMLPTVTLSLALATQRMARRNALVRHLPAVETLGSATVILTDKTGTLTQNRMTVRELFVAGCHRLAAERWPRAYDLHLRAVARFCHSLKFPNGAPSGDPMEIALWQFAGEIPELGSRAGEIPFDAERRRMSVITRETAGSEFLWCKGAPETVLPLCSTWLEGDVSRPFDAQAQETLRRAQNDMADRGLRVLALAWKPLAAGAGEPSEDGLELCGLIGLEDPPRPDVHEAVNRCHEAGIRVIMVTGDHPHTAVALAREVDVVRTSAPTVLTGDEVRRMDPASLQLALDAPEILFARVSAEQKMLIVQALQRKGEIVAVTGDGVNDAPALKTADIGIAMGLSGTDVAREAADIVLLDDHFGTIVNAIEEGRAVFENIRKFITYIFTHNFAELVPFLAFVLFRIPLPLTAILVLAIDLGTDTIPALALGAEPPHSDLMRRPPRRRDEHLFTWPMFARAYGFLGPLEALAAMATFFFVLDAAGWHYGQTFAPADPIYLQATTACFAGIVLTQMVNIFVCRHPLLPAWRFPLFENRLLFAGLAFEFLLLLAIVYTPWGNRLFGTAPLAAEVWLFALPFALALGVLEEARKAIVRRMSD